MAGGRGSCKAGDPGGGRTWYLGEVHVPGLLLLWQLWVVLLGRCWARLQLDGLAWGGRSCLRTVGSIESGHPAAAAH
jgi:hypothetical protein